MNEFKECVTSDGMYRVTKAANGFVYSLSISNDEADEAIKKIMRETIDGQVAMAAANSSSELD
jgi:hypothetical protein